jgi:dTDP-4-dehydrorhamnose 3,5-epimerase
VRLGHGESKLVRCSSGALFDVVVDLRPGSPTYRSWVSFELDGERQTSIFIPAGCAHGFQALTDQVDTAYRIDRRYDPSESLTIAHDDPDLDIPWPLPVSVTSPADAEAPRLVDLAEELARISVPVS